MVLCEMKESLLLPTDSIFSALRRLASEKERNFLIYSIMEKDISCPRCKGIMTFQGVESVGAGAARFSKVEVYLCSKCGCNGRFDEKAMKIIEIK